jgi:hypothetical protein
MRAETVLKLTERVKNETFFCGEFSKHEP